jgi:hypothetical protein
MIRNESPNADNPLLQSNLTELCGIFREQKQSQCPKVHRHDRRHLLPYLAEVWTAISTGPVVTQPKSRICPCPLRHTVSICVVQDTTFPQVEADDYDGDYDVDDDPRWWGVLTNLS